MIITSVVRSYQKKVKVLTQTTDELTKPVHGFYVCLDGNTVTLKHDTRYNTNTRKRIKKHVNSRYPGRSMVTTVVDHLLVFKTDIPVSDISIVDREARIMRATCELRASIEKLTTGTISRRSKEKPPHPYNTKTGRRRLTPAF